MEKKIHSLVKCKECGGKPCICQGSNGLWAAHCMDCDNAIGHGGYDPCALTEGEAEIRWNRKNTMLP